MLRECQPFRAAFYDGKRRNFVAYNLVWINSSTLMLPSGRTLRWDCLISVLYQTDTLSSGVRLVSTGSTPGSIPGESCQTCHKKWKPETWPKFLSTWKRSVQSFCSTLRSFTESYSPPKVAPKKTEIFFSRSFTESDPSPPRVAPHEAGSSQK